MSLVVRSTQLWIVFWGNSVKASSFNKNDSQTPKHTTNTNPHVQTRDGLPYSLILPRTTHYCRSCGTSYDHDHAQASGR